ncbi:MAG: hypothetical protein ACD_3C00086G0063 [uncultured bacterium (gcode 4)]|uniref:Uncharacterized protein n=1 Tax=uncultured bacterium (gcode 4) TaxID=1234023 RepID=K2GDB9_9BACT|nr:MAG: hypothetical protein ACD_3C00086G0063 [uncultured bacterium (gcode 4)]
MIIKDDNSFEALDRLSSWILSVNEKEPSKFWERVKEYRRILDYVLNTKIGKWDEPEMVYEKIRDTVAKLKLKHNLEWDASQIKTLKELIRNNWWRFVSVKQKAYFKANILKEWLPFDPDKNAFLRPMVDYKIDSDIWVIYEAYRFWNWNRNFGYAYFFIDDKWVRLAIEHKLVYKRINVPRNHGFSKDRPWHTRARRNEMTYWVEKFDENMFSEEKIIFEREE